MRTFARNLRKLEKNENIAYSSLSVKQRQKLSPLIESGVIALEYVGSGKKYVLRNKEALQRYIKTIFPGGVERAIEGTNNRIDATAVYRNSKQGSEKPDSSVILIRAFSSSPDLIILNGQELPAYSWCELAGCAAITLIDGDRLEINGNLGTVENKAVVRLFEHVETKDTDIDVVIYTEGRFSQRVIDCICVNERYKMVHFGDYDPVGVDEYLRLKNTHERVEMFIPDDLESLFKYGRKELLNDSYAIYEDLRTTKDQQAQQVVALMSKYNRGLEHEALLIKYYREINKDVA